MIWWSFIDSWQSLLYNLHHLYFLHFPYSLIFLIFLIVFCSMKPFWWTANHKNNDRLLFLIGDCTYKGLRWRTTVFCKNRSVSNVAEMIICCSYNIGAYVLAIFGPIYGTGLQKNSLNAREIEKSAKTEKNWNFFLFFIFCRIFTFFVKNVHG